MGLLAGLPLGALVEGRLGDLIGLRPTVVASSAALFAFVVLAVISFHGLRAIDLDLTYDDVEEAGPAVAPATAAATGGYSPPMPRRP